MNVPIKTLLALLLFGGVVGCSTTTDLESDVANPIDVFSTDAWDDSIGDESMDSSTEDTSADISVEDTAYEPEPGQTGWPCSAEDECDSGFCLGLEESESGYCSDICQQECPPGFLCKNQPQYGPVVFLCVAIEEVGCIKQCTTPNTFKGCGVPGALCADVDGLNFCLEPCLEAKDCKEGFSCTEFTDDGGFVLGKQCAPDSGSCICGLETDLASDPNHCGECGLECAYPNAEALCVDGGCLMGECLTGFSDLNEDTADGCEFPCEFISDEDFPDPDGIDANCDGIDGELARAVFVSTDGSDVGNEDGSMNDPFLTIGTAVAHAATLEPKGMVLVAAGTYFEQIQMIGGVTIAGGYSPATWDHEPQLNATVVFAKSVGLMGSIRVVVAEQITQPTRLSGFTFRTMNNPTPSGPVMGIWVRDSSAEFVIHHNIIEPGDGGIGQGGIDGNPGPDGANGYPGESGGPDNWWNPEATILGGDGGEHTCFGGEDSTGGIGGTAGWGDNPWFADEIPAGTGMAAPGGAAGGSAGKTKKNGGNGTNGTDGSKGQDGDGGPGQGAIEDNGAWFAAHGVNGEKGTNGTGGGGGGGGGGGIEGGIAGEHSHGGGGSGGGSGGCAGNPGTGGKGGGASFAIYVAGGSVTLNNNTVNFGTGGSGGSGGDGGDGGKRGLGTEPGNGFASAGDGGWGGKGGNGGRGGHGGGGGGGPSVGIFMTQNATPTCQGNKFIGSPKPGSGGLSKGKSGSDGYGSPIGPTIAPMCQGKLKP